MDCLPLKSKILPLLVGLGLAGCQAGDKQADDAGAAEQAIEQCSRVEPSHLSVITEAWFGRIEDGVSSGADLDGDGEPELIVGAPDFDRFDDEVEYSGEVYVYRSSTLAAGGIIPVSEADLFIDGSGTTGFGSTLRSADFDRSGSDELIVAAPRWNGTMGRLSVFALD